MAADGEALMDPRSHFDWFARALLLFNRCLLRQLPASYQVEVDPIAFLNSMTFVDGDKRYTPLQWRLAPDPPVHAPARNESERTNRGQQHKLSRLFLCCVTSL